MSNHHGYRCRGCGLSPRTIYDANPQDAARHFKMDIAQWGGVAGEIIIEDENGAEVYREKFDPKDWDMNAPTQSGPKGGAKG